MSKTTMCNRFKVSSADCVLASSPENVLFVLGVGWNGMSNPLLCHGIHSAARLFYNRPQSLFGARSYGLTCHQPPWTGRRGICSAQPTRCLRIIGRHLGCVRTIRTSSLAYGASMLPLHHQRNIDYFSLTLV